MLDVSESAVLDRILSLQDRGVIVPVSIQTILQRQGMGLANGEIGAVDIKAESFEVEEPLEDQPEPPLEEVAPEPEQEPEVEVEPEPEPEPEEEIPAPDPADEFVKEVESLMGTEPEEKKEELDPMDEFVKDVESLLTKEKKDEDE